MNIYNPDNGEAKPRAKARLRLAYERDDGTKGIVTGRVADTLQHLVKNGQRGVTPIERPAPRWSHYVFELRRKHGFNIETLEEKHGGPFAGTHGRYVLHDEVILKPAPPKAKKSETRRAATHRASESNPRNKKCERLI